MGSKVISFVIALTLAIFHCASAIPSEVSSEAEIAPKVPILPPGANCGSALQQTILEKIFQGYDKDVLPPPGNNATVVTANANIGRVVWVNEKIHQWRVIMYFRQNWNDARLQYSHLLKGCPSFPYITLTTPEAVGRLWKPDLHFVDEIEGRIHTVIQPNYFIRIYPNGDIIYSVHVDVTLFCLGTGSKPGEYLCPMVAETYAYTTDQLIIQWAAKDPIQIDRSQTLLDDHVIGDIDTFSSTVSATTGTFSHIVANWHFLRKACLQ